MSNKPLQYPVPWRLVFSLTGPVRRNEVISLSEFTATICAGIHPEPLFFGAENLPASPRFVLAANHYQRKGLWILHAAGVLVKFIERHYHVNPGMRWVVTANWPPIKIGPWQFASPGDRLLPKVARTLSCYSVPFASSRPRQTAQSIRNMLRDAPTLNCPIGLFPEGVQGTADRMAPPLPGIGRLLTHLARAGLPVLPTGISEAAIRGASRCADSRSNSDPSPRRSAVQSSPEAAIRGAIRGAVEWEKSASFPRKSAVTNSSNSKRFVMRFGELIPAEAILAADSPETLVMDQIRALAVPPPELQPDPIADGN